MNSSTNRLSKYKVKSERISKGRVFYIELSVHGNRIVFSKQNGLANPPRYTCAPLFRLRHVHVHYDNQKNTYIVDSELPQNKLTHLFATIYTYTQSQLDYHITTQHHHKRKFNVLLKFTFTNSSKLKPIRCSRRNYCVPLKLQ